ncbi:MAG: right-handed parallel beta-helix repeat-containing protein [Kiritimatiellales bacterium]
MKYQLIVSGFFLCSSVFASAVKTVDPVKTLQSLPPGKAADVIIEPGVYRLPEEGLALKDLKDVSIQAKDVTFIATHPKTTALSFYSCTNVHVQGLTLDYDPLPFTQGTITAVDPKTHTAEFSVHAGYSDLTADFTVNRFNLFDAETRHWKIGAPDYYVRKIEALPGLRAGRIYFEPVKAGFELVKPGDHVAINLRNAAGIYIRSGCADVNMTDVTVHAAPAIAIMIRFAENSGKFERVRIIPGPTPAGATEARLLSASADGFNSAYTRKGPVLQDCEFAFIADDGVNLHGATLPVLLWEDARTCISMRPGSDPFHTLLRSGDEVRFLIEPDYRLTGTACITGIEKADPPASMDARAALGKIWPSLAKRTQSTIFYRVRFDRDMKSLGKDGVFFECFASATPDYVIRNNYFHDHRGRGLRLMAGNGLVESNRIERVKGAGISSGPEFAFWREAGWVENLIIRDNIIRDAGQGMDIFYPDSYTPGAISIFARVLPNKDKTAYYQGNKNITITGNEIDGYPLDGISMVAAQDSLIASNIIRRVNQRRIPGASTSYGIRTGNPVNVQHSAESIEIKDNQIEK